MDGSMRRVLCVLLGTGLLLGCGSNPPAPAAPVISDINGGLSASGTTGSLFIVAGTRFSKVAAATAGHSVDFRDATTDAGVAPTPGHYAGGGMNAVLITPKGSIGLTASTPYKG